MIIMLSGPNKRLGFSVEVKKVLNRELKNCKSLVAIGAKELSEKNYKYFNGGEDSLGVKGMFKQLDININEITINIQSLFCKFFLFLTVL